MDAHQVIYFLWFLLMVATAMPSTEGPPASETPDLSIKCFACTSYVPSCRTTVNDTSGSVPHVACKTSCYLRQGYEKDLPLYRGCADDFQSVPDLDTGYLGCRKQTWNGAERVWCFCDKDTCNGASMEALDDLNADYDFSSSRKDDDFLSTPEAKDIYALRYNRDHPQAGQGLYADEPQVDLSREDGYAKEAPRSTQMPYRAEKAALLAARRERERVDGGVDRPYFPKNDKIYTDIEQVGGNNNNNNNYDAGSSPATRSPMSGHNAYPHVFPKPEDKDALLRQPYFPFDAPHDNDYDRSRRFESRQDRYEAKSTSAPGGVTQQSAQYYQRYEGQGNRPQDNFRYEARSPSTTAQPELHITPAPDRIICSHTGFIPNPRDCSTFLACILDRNLGKPVMHRMRCPDGLLWDNSLRVCVSTSSTCTGSARQAAYDHIPLETYERHDEDKYQ